MVPDTKDIQAINTSWQIAIQEILRMIIRDMYLAGGEDAFKARIKRIKERASNFVTTLLTSFTYERA
jgi:hypothetical protein